MRISGHPLHPALVHFPIAFWTSATILDGCALTGIHQASIFAWYCLVVSSVVALPAILTGFMEFSRLEEQVVKLGTRHMTLMCSAWLLYVAALMSRSAHMTPQSPSVVSYLLSAAGFLIMGWGGWCGGKMVYTYGAGR